MVPAVAAVLWMRSRCSSRPTLRQSPAQACKTRLSTCLQVCVDLSVLSTGFVDVATLRELPHHTGGQLYCYDGFNPSLDSDQLLNDLRWNLMRPQVSGVDVLSMTAVRFPANSAKLDAWMMTRSTTLYLNLMRPQVQFLRRSHACRWYTCCIIASPALEERSAGTLAIQYQFALGHAVK